MKLKIYRNIEIYVDTSGRFTAKTPLGEDFYTTTLEEVEKKIDRHYTKENARAKNKGTRLKVIYNDGNGVVEKEITSITDNGEFWTIDLSNNRRSKEWRRARFYRHDVEKIKEIRAIEEKIRTLERDRNEILEGLTITNEEIKKAIYGENFDGE